MPNYYTTELPKSATVAYYYPETVENEQLEQVIKENEIRLIDKLRSGYPSVVVLFNHNQSATMRFLKVSGALRETHTKVFPPHMSGVPCKHVGYEVDFDGLSNVERGVSRDIEKAKKMIDERYSREIKTDWPDLF